ncbi:hypothetical protein [Xanthomonas phage NEB7]|nr:hypothetical protein [Xanthomonas phage NEB7]
MKLKSRWYAALAALLLGSGANAQTVSPLGWHAIGQGVQVQASTIRQADSQILAWTRHQNALGEWAPGRYVFDCQNWRFLLVQVERFGEAVDVEADWLPASAGTNADYTMGRLCGAYGMAGAR